MGAQEDSHMRVAVIDTETTGIDSTKDQVVEIAAAVQGTHGLVHTSSLIRASCPIPPEAKAVHHITEDMIADAPTLSDFIPGMLDDLAHPEVWAAHNAPFDQGFLPQLSGKWVCTWRCALHLFPDAPGHSNQVLRYHLDLDLMDHEDLLRSLAPHRALYDVVVTHALLDRMLEICSLEELVGLSTTPVVLTTVRFGKHRGVRWRDVPRNYLSWVSRQTDMDPDTLHTARTILASR